MLLITMIYRDFNDFWWFWVAKNKANLLAFSVLRSADCVNIRKRK